jgi:hypothetical protein
LAQAARALGYVPGQAEPDPAFRVEGSTAR